MESDGAVWEGVGVPEGNVIWAGSTAGKGPPVSRPASRGSAKPAPMTLRHAKVRAVSFS